jgi:mRNA-degrading endonuclease RelE of RelBE toxin-antitoxin system
MKILIDKSFYKDWKKIKDQDLNQKVLSFIVEIQKAESLSSLSNLKKLVGTKSYFKERL